MNKTDIVSLYRCISCSQLVVCEKGNYHPWCGCGSDWFDWNNGFENITREEADRILKNDNINGD